MIERQHLTDEEFLSYCTYCQRAFPEGKWFARFWRYGRPLEFCRPSCAEMFLGTVGGNNEQIEDRYVPIRWNMDRLCQLERTQSHG